MFDVRRTHKTLELCPNIVETIKLVDHIWRSNTPSQNFSGSLPHIHKNHLLELVIAGHSGNTGLNTQKQLKNMYTMCIRAKDISGGHMLP